MTPLTLVWLRWVAYVLLFASVILTGLAVPQLTKARRAPYYVMREEALKRARRRMLTALMMQVVAVDILILLPRLATIVSAPTPVPIATLTSVPIFTSTPIPTCMPTATPTRRPTATPPFIPTPTSDVSLPDLGVSPPLSTVMAGENAHIALITLAADVDHSGQPVNPGIEFPPGDHRVYLFILYEGMANGVVWTFAIYREGELLDGTVELWEWGEQGRTYLYYEPPGGYEPGVYEIRVFIEEQLQGVAQFLIQEE